jgi:hypothetical protein
MSEVDRQKNGNHQTVVYHERDEQNADFNCSGVERAAMESHQRFLHL